MKLRKFLAVCCAAALVLASCSKPQTSGVAEAPQNIAGKLHVLATFAPVFCFAKNVAGDLADVEMLLPPDTGPHDFAFAPSDLRKLAGADVVVENGFGLEAWLDRAVQGGMKTGALRIVAARGISPQENPPELTTGTVEKKPGEDDEFGPNPHVWLDPILAIKEVENIRDGLMSKDPKNADAYLANANAFSMRLRNLDDEIGRAVEGLPSKRMLTFHDSFPYFAARYGFEVVGFVEAFPGKEPTPRYLQKLREITMEKKVRVLFSEPQYSPQILRSLSEDLKLPIAVIDPMETGVPSADYYETIMRQNLKSLTDALR
jgi:zinc/manganese transport system substrate-binding protein